MKPTRDDCLDGRGPLEDYRCTGPGTCRWCLTRSHPVTAPTPDEGVYGKYRVERVDGRDKPGGDKANARYFVLDYVNDPHAMKALRAYIDSAWDDNPRLGMDLLGQVADVRLAEMEARGSTLPDLNRSEKR